MLRTGLWCLVRMFRQQTVLCIGSVMRVEMHAALASTVDLSGSGHLVKHVVDGVIGPVQSVDKVSDGVVAPVMAAVIVVAARDMVLVVRQTQSQWHLGVIHGVGQTHLVLGAQTAKCRHVLVFRLGLYVCLCVCMNVSK